MKTFTAFRPNVPDTHDHYQKNDPDSPQYEGCVFTDGTVALRWLTVCRSTSLWATLDDMLRVHGHPEYGTYLMWHTEPASLPDWFVEASAHQRAA